MSGYFDWGDWISDSDEDQDTPVPENECYVNDFWGSDVMPKGFKSRRCVEKGCVQCEEGWHNDEDRHENYPSQQRDRGGNLIEIWVRLPRTPERDKRLNNHREAQTTLFHQLKRQGLWKIDKCYIKAHKTWTIKQAGNCSKYHPHMNDISARGQAIIDAEEKEMEERRLQKEENLRLAKERADAEQKAEFDRLVLMRKERELALTPTTVRGFALDFKERVERVEQTQEIINDLFERVDLNSTKAAKRRNRRKPTPKQGPNAPVEYVK